MLKAPLKEAIRTTKSHLDHLSQMGVVTVEDFLLNFPWRYSDETVMASVCDLNSLEESCVSGRLKHMKSMRTRNGKFMLTGVFYDETGEVDVMWFNQQYLKNILKNDTEVILTGKVKWSGSRGRMMSPKHEIPRAGVELIHSGRVIPVYHENPKINSKWIREKIQPLLYMTKLMEEPLPQNVVDKYELMSYGEAVSQVHFPDSHEQLLLARKRLGFDEMFAIQLGVMNRKQVHQIETQEISKSIQRDESVIQKFLDSLPFTLTAAQVRAVDEILADMSSPKIMNRLLEGDVGAGKTLVAALCLLNTVKSGYQGALMAPTEILAKQHFKNLLKTLGPFGVSVQLLSGSMKSKEKQQVINGLATKTIDIVVGTHALIQDSVSFKNLGLAVVDEQHRFGVSQRSVFKQFGKPHMLAMTATPIPRTLALTLYGDQELSILDEKPAGRKSIITRSVPKSKRKDAYLWVDEQIKQGRQAFVVCPLIEDSDLIEAKSAVSEWQRLSENVFPNLKIGLVHGKLKQDEKDDIMLKFKNAELDILVATTVIEVGIDIPNASIIIIESAERFGLAQLHQLRGRVGRGEHQSYCFLFPESNADTTRKRMKAMVDYDDGFKLSEIDLDLRGPGEVYGVRQSGIPDLKMSSLADTKLVAQAREAAEFVMNQYAGTREHQRLLETINISTEDIEY